MTALDIRSGTVGQLHLLLEPQLLLRDTRWVHCGRRLISAVLGVSTDRRPRRCVLL